MGTSNYTHFRTHPGVTVRLSAVRWAVLVARQTCFGRCCRPFMDHFTIIETIGATTTKTGLKVECALATRTHEKGIKISKAEIKNLTVTGDDFHPAWNYTITPRPPETLPLLFGVSLTLASDWGRRPTTDGRSTDARIAETVPSHFFVKNP